MKTIMQHYGPAILSAISCVLIIVVIFSGITIMNSGTKSGIYQALKTGVEQVYPVEDITDIPDKTMTARDYVPKYSTATGLKRYTEYPLTLVDHNQDGEAENPYAHGKPNYIVKTGEWMSVTADKDGNGVPERMFVRNPDEAMTVSLLGITQVETGLYYTVGSSLCYQRYGNTYVKFPSDGYYALRLHISDPEGNEAGGVAYVYVGR